MGPQGQEQRNRARGLLGGVKVRLSHEVTGLGSTLVDPKTRRDAGRGCVKTEAEAGAMWPRARGRLRPPQLESQEGPPPGPLQGRWPDVGPVAPGLF